MSNATTTDKFIIRADRAGVFYGEIAERRGSEVDLTNVRRVHYWADAASLSQVAMEGVGRSSRLTVVVPSMTVLGVIEVIPCSAEAVANMDAHPAWRA